MQIGKSLDTDPAVKNLKRKPRADRTAATVATIVDRLKDDELRHDGGSHLGDQLLAVRTLDGTDGLRLASTGRADAVKAAAWAIEQSRTAKPQRQRRLITAAS